MNNLRILTIKNAKLLGYYFYVNLNTKGDFQFCISVPLKLNFIDAGVLFEKPLRFKYFISISKSQQNIVRTCQNSQESNFNMLSILICDIDMDQKSGIHHF